MIPKEDCWKGRDWGGTQGKESSSIGGTSRGLSFGSRGGSERGEGPEIGGGGAPGVHAGGDAGTKRGRGGGGARPGRGGPALAKRGGRCPRQGGGWWDKAGETPPPVSRSPPPTWARVLRLPPAPCPLGRRRRPPRRPRPFPARRAPRSAPASRGTRAHSQGHRRAANRGRRVAGSRRLGHPTRGWGTLVGPRERG